MSNDLNNCQFIGRLGKDAEVRYTADGKAIANFSIAVGSKFKDKEHTEWVRCSAFDKLGEIVGQYCTKGKQVFVSGRMQTRKWQDKDGQDRYTTEIIVNQMQLLGSRGDSDDNPRDGKAAPAAKPAKQDTGSIGDMDDDIPF